MADNICVVGIFHNTKNAGFDKKENSKLQWTYTSDLKQQKDWDLLETLIGKNKNKNKYIHIHIYIHAYIYTYIHIYI